MVPGAIFYMAVTCCMLMSVPRTDFALCASTVIKLGSVAVGLISLVRYSNVPHPEVRVWLEWAHWVACWTCLQSTVHQSSGKGSVYAGVVKASDERDVGGVDTGTLLAGLAKC